MRMSRGKSDRLKVPADKIFMGGAAHTDYRDEYGYNEGMATMLLT